MTELSKRIEEEFQYDPLPIASDNHAQQQANLDFDFDVSLNSFSKGDVFEQIGADPEPTMKRQRLGSDAEFQLSHPTSAQSKEDEAN
mmetsp:Transcript_25552/g.39328  ORF Transcript_25552/g.39328 Transcript_25552/m.39328 type:complete len:87 (+) Transcript_25552:728-988(+)